MTRFRAGLAILVDEKRVNELLQQKSGLKALLRSTFNTVLFVSGHKRALPFSLVLSRSFWIDFHFDPRKRFWLKSLACNMGQRLFANQTTLSAITDKMPDGV